MHMGDVLRMSAGREPHKIAVRDARGGTTYADLDARTNAVANALLEIGVEPRTNVAVLMSNRTEHVEAMFGLAKIAATAVPMDPKWRSREMQAAFAFFDITAVIAETTIAEDLLRALDALPTFRGPVVWVGEPLPTEERRHYGYEGLMARGATTQPTVDVQPSDLFLLSITSGTTGFPKGCQVSHAKYIFSCLNHAIGRSMGADDLELVATPICFNSGRSSLIGHLFFGGSVILPERFDVEEALPIIERERVTYLAVAPVQADRLLQSPNLDRYDTSSLRCLRKAGSPFHRRTLEALIEHVTPYIYQSYASTDAGSVTLLGPDEQLTHYGTAGRRIWAAEAQIWDEQGRPLPPGELGEIVCRGPLVCDGYYKNPEATAASFRDGWFLTGDLGRFDDEGYLSVVGRRKHMIKSGSISIFPDEVQFALQTHPRVFEAGVVGVPDPEWGEAVVAMVSPLPGETLDPQDLIAYCKSQLASYKAPKRVEIVDALPHTELGKIATEAVRQQFLKLLEASGDAAAPPRA
jgi:acyl-CoA synthetase (AMP-forming)/AMP-acid ligase II